MQDDVAQRPDMPDHPLRQPLVRELHARPFPVIDGPAHIIQFAFVHDGVAPAEERRRLAELCGSGHAAPPGDDTMQHTMGCAGYQLTWERHTEFSTYMFLIPGTATPEDARAKIPLDWLKAQGGRLIATTHIRLVEDEADDTDGWLDGRNIVGGLATGGRARLRTDYDFDEDGYVRIRIGARGMSPRQAGRLVKRLLEIHAYSMMALLAFPLAREIAPSVAGIERALVDVAEALARTDAAGEERPLLGRLSELAAEAEALAARTSYRFGAARAYHALVEGRVTELREQRIEGQQTLAEFLDRRLTPAMRTCETTRERLERLSERVARASEMLRTRIDVMLAAQNRDLLASMDRRVKLQLRLQATVEGLSVAAITYYVVGLIAYIGQAAAAVGLPIKKELLVGAAVPIVAALCWTGIRHLRKHLEDDH